VTGLALAAGLLRLAESRAMRPPTDRNTVALVALCLAPALVTYLLIHIGQLAYVLFGVPLLLLFAGPVLTRLAALTLRRGELARARLRAVAATLSPRSRAAIAHSRPKPRDVPVMNQTCADMRLLSRVIAPGVPDAAPS
jgi:hypothetical protein